MSKFNWNGVEKVEYNGKMGIWRTVGGRRIFISDGQDLATAMKLSGKFPVAKLRIPKSSKIKEDLNTALEAIHTDGQISKEELRKLFEDEYSIGKNQYTGREMYITKEALAYMLYKHGVREKYDMKELNHISGIFYRTIKIYKYPKEEKAYRMVAEINGRFVEYGTLVNGEREAITHFLYKKPKSINKMIRSYERRGLLLKDFK